MKILILTLTIFFNLGYLYSQDKEIEVSIKALDIGVYNKRKVKKNKLKVVHGEEARKAVAKRIEGNQELIEYVGGYLEEQDIISYYPQEDIAIFECPVRGAGVHDLKTMEDGYGDPATYLYSPSEKYRFSSFFDASGTHYYIEKKDDGKYVYLGTVFLSYLAYELSGFYWKDDKTLYYLKECRKADDSKYWIGYSASFMFLEKE